MRLTSTVGCLVLLFAATAGFDVWKARTTETKTAQADGSDAPASPAISNHDALARRLGVLMGTVAR